MIKLYFKQSNFELYLASCIDFLPQLKENSVDMIFADPPYLLSK